MSDVAASTFDRNSPLQGRLHLFLAFDLGEEIDLEHVMRLAAAQKHALPRRRRTPSSVGYHPAPVQLLTAPVTIELPEIGQVSVAAEATLFDFAATSLAFKLPFSLSAERLSAVASALAEPAAIVAAARCALEPLFELLRPAITDPQLSATSEEYVVFELPPGAPLPAPSQLLSEHANWLAGLIRLESEPLSSEEVQEALRLRLSYTPDDLFLPEWSAALLVDRDCEDTLETIEFANLQLLEFRYTDQRLDKRLAAAYRFIHPLTRSWLPFWQTHARPLRELGDLRIEANSVFERAGNALKLIGDQYLARVYKLLVARFHLDDWQHSIERSLNTLDEAYRIVSDQAATYRAEFLELMIVLLIVFDIALSFVR